MIEDFDDFPTVGLTGFDEWMTKLFVCMVVSKFLNVTELGGLDRGHWRTYYDMGYSPQEAFEEDLTAYGD
jgi:hypothetical protein